MRTQLSINGTKLTAHQGASPRDGAPRDAVQPDVPDRVAALSRSRARDRGRVGHRPPGPLLAPSTAADGHDALAYDLRSPRLHKRPPGRSVLIQAVALRPLERVELDLFRLEPGGALDGRSARIRQRRQADRHARVNRSRPERRSRRTSVHGRPARSAQPWGASAGTRRLPDGPWSPPSRLGAPSWFPCNDHPTTRRRTHPGHGRRATGGVANGTLTERTSRGADRVDLRPRRSRWPPIWPRSDRPLPARRVLAPRRAAGRSGAHAYPSRLPTRPAHDLGRQPDMLRLSRDLFGPYPFDAYTVVVTTPTSSSRSRPRARRSSAPTTRRSGAAGSAWSRTSSRTSGSATAWARDVEAHLAQRGLRDCTPSGCGRSTRAGHADELARRYWQRSRAARPEPAAQPIRARAACSTTGSTSAAR